MVTQVEFQKLKSRIKSQTLNLTLFAQAKSLTSIWRLHTSPIRRIIRLFKSIKELIYFNKNIYYLKNIKVKKLSA